MAYNWGLHRMTKLRAAVVPYILPVLIRAAKEGHPITYTELAEELKDAFGIPPLARKTWYGWPVGYVGKRVRGWDKAIPPINVIVIGATSGQPGIGADDVASYYTIRGQDIAKRRKDYMKAAADAVFDYGRKWDEVAKHFKVDVLPTRASSVDGSEPIALPKIPAKFGPESPNHKALKAWAAAHPDQFKRFGIFRRGKTEEQLSSGDRLDAYFFNGIDRLAVEVKASNANDDELKRGVYQCVKYRAVLRAENLARRLAPAAAAVLVSTRKPSKDVKALSKLLDVDFIQVPLSAEQ